MFCKKILPVLALASLAFPSNADSSNTNMYKLEDWSFGVSGGTNIWGRLNREGHGIRQKNSAIFKANADKRISDEYSIGFSAMYQFNGRLKDTYKIGVQDTSVNMKYRTLALLATGKYHLENSSYKLKPYLTGALGVSLNMPKDEIHVANSITSTFSKKGTHIQPAAAIGFGANYMVSDSQKIFVEYQLLYSGRMKTSGNVTTGGVTTTEKLSNALLQNIVTVGLEFKI